MSLDMDALVRQTIARQHAEIERLTERCAAYRGQVEEGSHQIKRLRAAIRWALGEAPDADGKWFGDSPHSVDVPKRYWWRKHLREMAAIDQQQGQSVKEG